MSSDEEGFDISKSLGTVAFSDDSGEESSSEFGGFSGDEAGGDFDDDVQDEIIYSDNEDQDAVTKNQSFPTLELSDNEDDDKEDISSYFAAPVVKKASNGSFAGLGLSKMLLGNINRKGFRKPTPIQRKSIPLALDGKDLVGMARTGSGKTAAFVLPMLERLKVHSAKIGARALIMAPNREVALQTLKAVKEFGKGSDLRSVLLVGGDSLEDQFGYMMTNPDIVIATPGRFLHLKVEMKLNLKSIEYVVFDEADQLFELGFAEQLDEILASLSTNRQTLLFSATLPSTLVEFAKAGLQDPVLIRLDSETKISEDLQMSFFTCKEGEREAALCAVLQDVIKMPPMTPEQRRYIELSDKRYMEESADEGGDDHDDEDGNGKKRKPKLHKERLPKATDLPTPESTILFVPTKHHVEYYVELLQGLGYAVSYSYSTLHQTARKEQLWRFRAGKTSIFVVTDVAARGIDIPMLAYVVNLSLPSSPKVFVHRAGRTARAGQRGWAYTLVKETELPQLIDLELFLGRKILFTRNVNEGAKVDYTRRLVIGSLPRDSTEMLVEQVTTILKRDYDLEQLKQVAERGEKQYLRSLSAQSKESVKRAKDLVHAGGWNDRHVLFGMKKEELAAEDLLRRLSNRRNKDTVFEYKKTSNEDSVALMMARRRAALAPIQQRALDSRLKKANELSEGAANNQTSELFKDVEEADEEDIKAVFQDADDVLKSKKRKRFRDDTYFMSHFSGNTTDRGYNVNGGFSESARSAAFNLTDEGREGTQKQGTKWDKKKGKFVNAGSEEGKKYIRGENGNKIPASLRSGRFDKWKSAHKASDLQVGAQEKSLAGAKSYSRFKHNNTAAPVKADKSRDDYHKQKKKVASAMERGLAIKGMRNNHVAKSGIKSTENIRKSREVKNKRREKNARPSRKKK